MYKNFNLTESEKEQILNMHKDKGYGKGVNEQSVAGASNYGTYSKDATAKPVAKPAAPQPATNGWWDKHPALASYMKEKAGKVYFPPAANSENGAIAIAMDGGSAHDFFPDGRWYQYASVEEGLKAVVKAQYEGKWSEKNGLLMIQSTDGEIWNSKTKKWTKPIQWVKQSGKFPLKYLEYGGTIKPLQASLGIKQDGYFYNGTEKAVLAKAPEYKRETGVTQEIYNKIVPNVAVGRDLKTTYDMNTQAGKDAYLQQGLKTTSAVNPAAKYSQITPQQQANADALKNGQPLPK